MSEPQEIAREEWIAWQKVVHEFRSLGLDMNDDQYNPLIAAVEQWGEELVRLRVSQAPGLRERVLEEKREQYESNASPGFVPPDEREQGWSSMSPLSDN